MSSFQTIDLGIQWQYENYQVYFGNRRWGDSVWEQKFPHVEFKKIKQVHGCQVVPASIEIIEADAHFTSHPATALQIKTADCLSIFIVDPVQKNIMAIHAGWRGVANLIVSKAVVELNKLGGNSKNFKVVIGPHIKRQSFEVDHPVWAQLMEAIPLEFQHQSALLYDRLSDQLAHQLSNQEVGQKYKVDLEGIVRLQLQVLQVSMKNIEAVDIDTVTDLQWHSYRRDKDKSGRNISFIYRNA